MVGDPNKASNNLNTSILVLLRLPDLHGPR